MLKSYDFECDECQHLFNDLVEGVSGLPEECPACKSPKGFTKRMSAPMVPKVIVIDYPGSKRFKAGYVHTHADRPAEKKASQVSMFRPGKK